MASISRNEQGQTGELDHLDHGCQLISEIYGKPIADWTNSDYIRLGHILYKRTHVQISPSTLKRIFGKIKTEARYYPQKATRDALANYIGYPDWESFTSAQASAERLSNTPFDTEAGPVKKTVVSTNPVAKNHAFQSRASKILTGLIILVLVTGIVKYYVSQNTPVVGEVSIVCRNPLGGNPHSAIFALTGIDQVTDLSDPFIIDFGDNRKLILGQSDTLISHYYEKPGRYYAVLKRRKQTLDTATIFLQSAGWTATAEMMYDSTRVYPIDLKGQSNSVSALDVAHAGVDTNRTFFVHFVNSQPTTIDGDNFDLVARLQTSADRAGVRCSQVRVTVFGESSRQMINVMKPGCLHWASLQMSDISKDGHLEDLNFLGADFRQGGTIRLNVEQRHAKLYIDEKVVYETTYSLPMKKIYGIGIMFSGIGKIYSVTLKDLKNIDTFAGNF